MEYIIPINPESDELDGFNLKHETKFKTTDWHVEKCIETFVNALMDFAGNNTLYIGDHIRVKVEITYEPEDK